MQWYCWSWAPSDLKNAHCDFSLFSCIFGNPWSFLSGFLTTRLVAVVLGYEGICLGTLVDLDFRFCSRCLVALQYPLGLVVVCQPHLLRQRFRNLIATYDGLKRPDCDSIKHTLENDTLSTLYSKSL